MKNRRNLTLSIVALAIPLSLGLATAPKLQGQTPTSPVPAAPQWQIDAGGKMEFDVASVKQNTAAPSVSTQHSNFSLFPTLTEPFLSTGGLLSGTNLPLIQYITFAYNLSPVEVPRVESQLPKWANTNRYDIQGRASGNPTQGQFQRMMQALLTDRFKLAIHYETRQLPVFALVLDKPGKLRPKFRPHPDDSSCSTAPTPSSGPGFATLADGFPVVCGGLVAAPSPTAPGRLLAGARGVTMGVITSTLSFTKFTGIDRPVLDKTGLVGKFDFVIEYSPQISGPAAREFVPDPSGPLLEEALREQLGLRLEATKGPVDVLVIDHVEEPSPN